jgi:uncharacterized GH25 family protein
MRLIVRVLCCALFFSSSLFAAVTGALVTPEGKPVENATVRLFARRPQLQILQEIAQRKNDLEPLASATSNDKGEFKLEVAKSGNYEVMITAPGFAPARRNSTGTEDLGGTLLRPAALKQGKVTAAGKAVADAVLVFVGETDPVRYVTRTDEAGRYTVPDVDSWRPLVHIFHPAWARVSSDALTVDSPRYDFRLDGGKTLRGKVLAPDGKSGAKANLVLDGWPAGESGEDGTFVIERVPEQWKRVEAITLDLIAAGSRSNYASMRLARGLSLGGQVLDGKSRRSLSGAVVILREKGGAVVRSVTSDSRGTYIFAPLLPGELVLDAQRSGYGGDGSPFALTTTVAEKNVSMERLVTLSGRVVDGSGQAVAAARLQTRGRSFFFPRPMDESGVSAPDGRFIFHFVAADKEVDLHTTRSGYAPSKEGPFRFAPGDEKSGVTVTLQRGVAIRGKVLSQDDQPVAGAKIGVQEVVGRQFGSWFREGWNNVPETARDGSFEIRVNPGTYDLFVRAAGYAPALRHQLRVTAQLEPLTIKLDAGFDVSGRVVEVGGAGIKDVHVVSNNDGTLSESMTDEGGNFRLTSLPNRTVNIEAYKEDGSVEEEREVKAPRNGFIIEVTPTVVVSGHVVDKASGAGVIDFTATIKDQESRSGGSFFFHQTRSSTVHDAGGKFTIEGVPTRPAELYVTAAGYQPGKSTLKLDSGKNVENLEIALEKGARLVGHVSNSAGEALDDVYIEAAQGTGATFNGIDSQPTRTDSDGNFTIEGVPSGELVVSFRKEGYQGTRKTISVNGPEVRADAQLDRGKTLTGHVVSSSGAPIADAAVQADSQTMDSQFSRTTSGNNGAFTLTGLAPGIYRLVVSRLGYVTKIEQNVDPEKTPDITLQLEAGAIISGKITGLPPAELAHTRVSARGERDTQFGFADAAGDYRIEGAPTGSVTVIASVSGEKLRQSEPVAVETTAGGDIRVDLEFKEGIIVSGRVTLNGKPLANGSVGFRPKAPPASFAASNIGVDGGYEVLGLKEGNYNVVVMEPSTSLVYIVPYSVSRSTRFDIDVAPQTLRGRAVERDTNEALRGVEIVAEMPAAADNIFSAPVTTSDSDGSFAIPGLSPGEYRLRAAKSGYASVTQSVTLSSSTTPVELRMTPSDGFVLRLLDSRNGRPVQGDVTLKGANGEVVFNGSGVTTPEGAMKIAVAPGSYRTTVGSYGLATIVTTLTSPGSREITLTPGGAARLQTSFSTAQRARIVGADGNTYPYQFWNASEEITILPGNTTLEHIAPGSYTLQLLDRTGAVTKSVSFVINEGGVTKVDL